MDQMALSPVDGQWSIRFVGKPEGNTPTITPEIIHNLNVVILIYIEAI